MALEAAVAAFGSVAGAFCGSRSSSCSVRTRARERESGQNMIRDVVATCNGNMIGDVVLDASDTRTLVL